MDGAPRACRDAMHQLAQCLAKSQCISDGHSARECMQNGEVPQCDVSPAAPPPTRPCDGRRGAALAVPAGRLLSSCGVCRRYAGALRVRRPLCLPPRAASPRVRSSPGAPCTSAGGGSSTRGLASAGSGTPTCWARLRTRRSRRAAAPQRAASSPTAGRLRVGGSVPRSQRCRYAFDCVALCSVAGSPDPAQILRSVARRPSPADEHATELGSDSAFCKPNSTLTEHSSAREPRQRCPTLRPSWPRCAKRRRTRDAPTALRG